MSEYFPLRGICLQCQTGTVCDEHQGRAVLECGSFESLAGAGTVVFERGSHHLASSTYHGLCRDCEIRGFCEDAHITGGVWECAQYR